MDLSVKSYYLKQMGIEQWVRRGLAEQSHVSELDIVAPKDLKTPLMVFMEKPEGIELHQWLLSKSGQLLLKMLHSIGLSQDNTSILSSISVVSDEDVSRRDALIKEQLNRYKPRLILILGSFVTKSFHQAFNDIAVITSCHPEELLIQPQKKKNVFFDLMMVKSKLV